MEVVNFCNSPFWKIPEQDNPAFGDEECYMVVQDSNDDNITLVIHIKPVKNPKLEESVTNICRCWDSNKALEIAELLANS